MALMDFNPHCVNDIDFILLFGTHIANCTRNSAQNS